MTSTNTALQLPERPDPNIPQKQATIPEHDVWVSASAGSGKTKVLTDRVLRLLLPDPQGRWQGAAPHKILCITFTKAAAALMALRVQNKLGEWAVMSDDKLAEEIEKLIEAKPSEDILKAARKLFSTVLDTTGGISIMTIHAFCQSTLGRFAIEAGVTPGFKVIEESRANDILSHIIDDLITDIQKSHSHPLRQSFVRVATYMDLDKLRATILTFMAKKREVTEFLETCENDAAIFGRISDELDYKEGLLPNLKTDDLLHMSRTLAAKGGKKEQEYANLIASWLALEENSRLSQLSLLIEAFCTGKGELRKFTKAIVEDHAELSIMRDAALEEIEAYLDNQAIERQSQQTADLLRIVHFCMTKYGAKKKELNALDFNDLILKTRSLLESEKMDWVQFKLDEGIDHVLVDEAQDTNINQWKIIEKLTDEFLSGQGDDTRLRSLFVVGDEKQSIFSFHGADPDAFHTMRDYFEKRSNEAGRIFNRIPLETSFRSAFPILHIVDTVFEPFEAAAQIGIPKDKKLVHFAYRNESPGLVELWDLELTEKEEEKDKEIKWKLPRLSLQENKTPADGGSSSPLAAKIAQTISGWLQKGEMLESENRQIEPRDILVLVRTRTRFVPDLVRQLKLRGVPVSGIDRMKLNDQIAVMDCIALAKFARFPDDDLSLACVLRSPFIRMTEDQLMSFALNREGSLWDSVQKQADQNIVTWLNNAITTAGSVKPFDFFDDLLNSPCPYQNAHQSTSVSGWNAFSTCLGVDCVDPLDEFLSYCLSKEADGVYSLEELIMLLQKSEIEIKRDTEDGDKDSLNQVRIMTIHASKGLEAPIVFLPDTTGIPSKTKIDALQWITTGANSTDIPLWTAQTPESCKAYQALRDNAYEKGLAEHMRLLYVALTRPRDRLYIMGENKNLKYSELCWYKYVLDAFMKLDIPRIEGEDVSGWRYKTVKAGSDKAKKEDLAVLPDPKPLPDWALKQVSDDHIARPVTIQPSKIGSDEDRAQSPLDTHAAHRFRRGTLTHKLFQILPDLPVAGRQQAAEKFLNRLAKDLPEDIRLNIITETLGILNDPVFADVFGENSLAEVPVSGDMGDGRMISGQIDRLVIGHNKIVIVDFKTNRPSPRDENDIPEAYKNQLRAYKTAMSRIFPDKEIICGLLWTDQPLLMRVNL